MVYLAAADNTLPLVMDYYITYFAYHYQHNHNNNNNNNNGEDNNNPNISSSSSSFHAQWREDYIHQAVQRILENHASSEVELALWIYLSLKRDFILRRRVSHEKGDKNPSEGGTVEEEEDPLEEVLHTSLMNDPSCHPIEPFLRFINETVNDDDDEKQNNNNNNNKKKNLDTIFFSESLLFLLSDKKTLEDWIQKKRECTEMEKKKDEEEKEKKVVEEGEKATSSTTGTELRSIEFTLSMWEDKKKKHKLQALLQPNVLLFILRKLEDLFILKYILKQIKILLTQKKNQLLAAHPTASNNNNNNNNNNETYYNGLSVQEVTDYHDYEMLFSLESLKLFLSHSEVNDNKEEEDNNNDNNNNNDNRSMNPQGKKDRFTTLLSLIGDANHFKKRMERRRRQQEEGDEKEKLHHHSAKPSSSSKLGALYTPQQCLYIVLSPALSQRQPNPFRVIKNKRIEMIEKAATDYYYYHRLLSGMGGENGPGEDGQSSNNKNNNNNNILDFTEKMKEQTVIMTDRFDVHRYERERIENDNNKNRIEKDKTIKKSLSEMLIGFDIQIMSLTGAALGYYFSKLYFYSSNHLENNDNVNVNREGYCYLCAALGYIIMLLIDTVLLLIKVRHEDEKIIKNRKKVWHRREEMNRQAIRFNKEIMKGLARNKTTTVEQEEEETLQKTINNNKK